MKLIPSEERVKKELLYEAIKSIELTQLAIDICGKIHKYDMTKIVKLLVKKRAEQCKDIDNYGQCGGGR